MDWDEYKALCRRLDYFSRFALEETKRTLEPGRVRQRLGAILAGMPSAKPRDHLGSAETDQFLVDLELADVQLIIRCLDALVDSADGPARGRYDHLRLVWREYATLLSQQR